MSVDGLRQAGRRGGAAAAPDMRRGTRPRRAALRGRYPIRPISRAIPPPSIEFKHTGSAMRAFCPMLGRAADNSSRADAGASRATRGHPKHRSVRHPPQGCAAGGYRLRHSCSGRSGSRVLRVSLLIVSRLRPGREIVGVVESERFGLVPGCAWGAGSRDERRRRARVKPAVEVEVGGGGRGRRPWLDAAPGTQGSLGPSPVTLGPLGPPGPLSLSHSALQVLDASRSSTGRCDRMQGRTSSTASRQEPPHTRLLPRERRKKLCPLAFR